VEIDAGLDLDAARRDAQIDCYRRSELERRFDFLNACGRNSNSEEAATTPTPTPPKTLRSVSHPWRIDLQPEHEARPRLSRP